MRNYRKWVKKAGKGTRTEQATQRGDFLSSDLASNEQMLLQLFSHAPDLALRHLQIHSGEELLLVYLEDMVDKVSLNDQILRPLLYEIGSTSELFQITLPIGKVRSTRSWEKVEEALFDGNSVLFIEGHGSALVFQNQGWPQRQITEPQNESTLKGGHQGFVETASRNIALIRRYLPNRQLKIQQYIVGKRSRTEVSLLFLQDIVNPQFVTEIEDRVQQIDVDAMINSGELVEFIEDHPFTLFPQFLLTERPDSVASHLLQGRIALVVDRSPAVLIGPASFPVYFQSVDDYSTRWMIASFLRILRLFAFFIAISLPSLYIAMVSFHYEVIPLDLLISVGESREQVPFPPILEALLMEFPLEMLREAGLRLPAPIGQTIGVVGGIVIGQAAVQAGIVSNIMVIIVALTAIASFIVPDHDMASAIRLVRFPMMISAALFGMIGISIGLMILIAHLISLESLGMPYGTPNSPMRLQDWKDTWIRFPLWKMNKRPLSTDPKQGRRQQAASRKSGDR
ncbi:spore germination protein [Brevibacillus humidisoli]|uniref:spore germination protein n=1 Tax=Brevibacillus humidisoli TaxID=2895522 RepID=UPI001E38BE95|nr:spore germination protein [Brevibacillus humidisoli]UFJ40824.1 spore germination protein [Brevibacillus humidisoli]